MGDAGLSQLFEICRVLQKKCTVDRKCGVHVHIGNLNWNKEDVVYSYLLALKLEDEIFLTLPKSRRNNSYCRHLDSLNIDYINLLRQVDIKERELVIDQIFNNIYRFLLVNCEPSIPNKFLNKFVNHPRGSKCGFDKSSQRYCWLNYVTLLFNTKGISNSHTLEFRSMSGTLNYNKVKNYLKMAVAICGFVDNYKSLILNNYEDLTLKFVIDKVFPKTGNNLNNYLELRKQHFNTNDESLDFETEPNINKKSIKEVVCV